NTDLYSLSQITQCGAIALPTAPNHHHSRHVEHGLRTHQRNNPVGQSPPCDPTKNTPQISRRASAPVLLIEPATSADLLIRVVESIPESVTNFTVQLIAERGIHLYAYDPKNDAWKHVAARLTIRDADGQIVDSRVSYPDGLKVETGFLGDLYVYRDSTDLRVAITDKTVKRPLSLTLEGAGYNHLQNACLGRIKLNAVRK
ncbi:hypothetical protein, partial [Rhodopirellula europaea]|uniref:hypothetical protein n=1 Tax=Rhodopirellula europaea TaxID=1263866 RepID=UPI0030EC8CE5